ncbi:putative Ig domain-containing protein [Bosea massiliensis]|uniref:Ig domain-containing protein n=1 Tax=Bosea massiliensis TaxID=151419 RepID=A0ABW0P514_9HYPH
MSVFSVLRKFVEKLRGAKSGTVAVEFALILPFAMMIYAGGSYTSGMVTLNKKMQSASYAMVNSVPYPRTVCSYRMHIENMYGTGAQVDLMRELLYPFPVTEANTTVRYIETAPTPDGKFTSRVRVEYRPTDGGLRVLANMYSAFGGPDGLERSTVWAESANVTITNDIPVCPDTPLRLNFDPNAGVSYFEVLSGSPHNNTVTASGGVRFKGKYRPYSVANLPPGLTFETETGKFGIAVNYPCQASNPGCDPVTWAPTVFTVQDYRDKIYDSPPGSATVTGQYVIYYPVGMSMSAGSGIIYQGQAINDAYQPEPRVWGGWKVGGTPKGYTFTSSAMPAGLWINGLTGNIHGTTTAWPGTYSFSITATDSRGVATSATYSLEIRAQPLQISVGLLNMQFQQPGSIAVNGTGGAGIINVTCSGMPAGMLCGPTWVSGQVGVWQQVGSVWGTPSTYGDFYPTITLTDQAGNSVSQVMRISIAMPPASHYATGWNQTVAGQWTYAHVYVSGGSGNFSLYACGSPPGMNCYQADATTFYWAGNPAPSSGTAWIQFRDNVTGVVYQQNLNWGFSTPPISVWVTAAAGNFTTESYIEIHYGYSGGYGTLYTGCSGFVSGGYSNMCYAHTGYSYGWQSNCLSVWDAYGASSYACHSFYISPTPISAWATTGFNFTYCRYGCIGYQSFQTGGGVAGRGIAAVYSSPDSQPGISYWDGVSGTVQTNWGQWNSSITVVVGDGIGQQAAIGMGF